MYSITVSFGSACTAAFIKTPNMKLTGQILRTKKFTDLYTREVPELKIFAEIFVFLLLQLVSRGWMSAKDKSRRRSMGMIDWKFISTYTGNL